MTVHDPADEEVRCYDGHPVHAGNYFLPRVDGLALTDDERQAFAAQAQTLELLEGYMRASLTITPAKPRVASKRPHRR